MYMGKPSLSGAQEIAPPAPRAWSPFADSYGFIKSASDAWSSPYKAAARQIFGVTTASFDENGLISEWCKFADLAVKAGPAYMRALNEERLGTAVPSLEPTPDFSLASNVRAQRIPPTHMSVAYLESSAFTRVLKFDHDDTNSDLPCFVIVAPNSGTTAQQMKDTVLSFLKIGNVRLVEQRDPHYVPEKHVNGLDDSTTALIEVVALNSKCHLIGISQSSVPATVATAFMFQNAKYQDSRPASLTVLCGPINAQLAPESINWMATSTYGEPAYIHVGSAYEGAGRKILPGNIPELYFNKMTLDHENVVRQALPAEHIHDTLQRVFREFWLPKKRYVFNGQKIDTDSITCPVLTFAGENDLICPAPQTHDLHRLTPKAAWHEQMTLAGTDHYGLIGRYALTKVIVPSLAETARRLTP